MSQRDAAYAGIRELDFEHELGNLSKDDYQGLRGEYRRKAAGILGEIDKAARGAPSAVATSPEVEIESAVKRLRQRRGRDTTALECPLCREPVESTDNHCPNCGAALARFCSGCGESREPEDKFCRSCGKAQAVPS